LDILWWLSLLNWLSVLDILLVALVFYGLLYLMRGTQAVQLLRGLLLLMLVVILITNVLELRAFKWLIRNSVPALLVSIPVVFQPELRQALDRLGRTGWLIARPTPHLLISRTIEQICLACGQLSERRHGALIVLERETGLQDYVETGITIGGRVSAELLTTIFFPNAPLHDGAVIVRQDKVLAAACVLPLTTRRLADRQLGLRHRAALGITEQSDALAVVVSEETGIISIAYSGRMIRRLDTKRLGNVLRAFYWPQAERALPRWLERLLHARGRTRTAEQ